MRLAHIHNLYNEKMKKVICLNWVAWIKNEKQFQHLRLPIEVAVNEGLWNYLFLNVPLYKEIPMKMVLLINSDVICKRFCGIICFIIFFDLQLHDFQFSGTNFD